MVGRVAKGAEGASLFWPEDGIIVPPLKVLDVEWVGLGVKDSVTIFAAVFAAGQLTIATCVNGTDVVPFNQAHF